MAGLLGALAALLILSPPVRALTTPTLATFASGSVPVGGTITDTAILGSGSSPTGTITFTIYGPTDTKCAGTPVFTSPAVKVAVPTVSPAYTPTAPGTYQIIAAYSGDTNNSAVTGTCGEIAESVAVTQATPTLITAASAVSSAGTLTDTAALTGGYKPTGLITFNAYGPNDATCASPVFTSAEPASTSTVSSAFRPPAAGTYRWIAHYGGDANNTAVAGSCADPAEAVTVPASAIGPAAAQPACSPAVAQAMANSVLSALAAALTGAPGGAFKSDCSSGLRIVLRAKEIRPGNKGFPRHDGFTTMANTLTHSSTTGQLAFSLNSEGTALKAYATSAGQSLTVFAIVHVRPDHTSVSSEAIQILTLGP
ncbi:MAG TPA: hypothetical protein VG165_09265 [Solirubrobacteraceae bacterium]|nr:hypothetical protein [Solirubrobacteraceae bacterium]